MTKKIDVLSENWVDRRPLSDLSLDELKYAYIRKRFLFALNQNKGIRLSAEEVEIFCRFTGFDEDIGGFDSHSIVDYQKHINSMQKKGKPYSKKLKNLNALYYS